MEKDITEFSKVLRIARSSETMIDMRNRETKMINHKKREYEKEDSEEIRFIDEFMRVHFGK